MIKKLISAVFAILLLCSIACLTACLEISSNYAINFIVDNNIVYSIETAGNETINMPKDPIKDGCIFDGWYLDNGKWQKPFTSKSVINKTLSSNMSVYAKFTDRHVHNYKEQEAKIQFLKSRATCLGKAVYYYSCVCGAVGTETFEYGSPLDHSFTNYVSDKNAKCLEDGTKTAHCDHEGCAETDTMQDVDSKTGHTYSSEWTSDENYHWHQATCEHTSEIIDKTSHNESDWIVDTIGTYAQKGSSYKQCNVCKKFLQSKDEIIFKTLSVDDELKVYAKVPTFQTTYDFNNEVEAIGEATYIVSTDSLGINQVSTKIVSLEIGDNTFYITETVGGQTRLFTVSVRRKSSFIVSFDSVGGTSVDNQQIEDGAFANEPQNPTKIGYTFKSWDYDFANAITEDKTITAIWEANKYQVTFESNGGSSVDKKIATFGSDFILPDDSTKAGYTLGGWYLEDTEYTNGVWETASDITLTAKWNIITYSITYNLNDGTNDSSNPATYTIESGTIILQEPTRDAYTFNGWDNNGKITKGSIGDKTFTASWTPIVYSITYILNGGTNSSNNPKTYTIESEVINLKDPTKTAYTFNGWDNDGIIEQGSKGDITITASWTPTTYSITYNLDGGENNSNNQETYTIESETITLQSPSKVDKVEINYSSLTNGSFNKKVDTTVYTFFGWYLESTFANRIDTIEKGSMDNKVLYAKWNGVTTTENIEEAYHKDGDYIYFGTYPQSDVTSSMSSDLSSYVSTKPTSSSLNGWTSYKYYISSSNSTDFMWYKDIEHTDGNRYRAVYFTSNRPWAIDKDASFNSGVHDQYKNGYYTSTVYWFKYESIRWKILTSSDTTATILAELLIDSQNYNNTKDNNYANSTIRAWLNDNFYNTAFNDLQKGIINTVTVDNSARSTNPDNLATCWNSGNNSYACANTQDKVWLLSVQEATKASYGLDTNYSVCDTARQKKSSDYAKCMGCYTNDNEYPGNGIWLLRSSSYDESYYIRTNNVDGKVEKYWVTDTSIGIVPALQINWGN